MPPDTIPDMHRFNICTILLGLSIGRIFRNANSANTKIITDRINLGIILNVSL